MLTSLLEDLVSVVNNKFGLVWPIYSAIEL